MINCLEFTICQELCCVIVFNTYNWQDRCYYSHFTDEKSKDKTGYTFTR